MILWFCDLYWSWREGKKRGRQQYPTCVFTWPVVSCSDPMGNFILLSPYHPHPTYTGQYLQQRYLTGKWWWAHSACGCAINTELHVTSLTHLKICNNFSNIHSRRLPMDSALKGSKFHILLFILLLFVITEKLSSTTELSCSWCQDLCVCLTVLRSRQCNVYLCFPACSVEVELVVLV